MSARISIVVPCYNEEEVLPLFVEEVRKIPFEFEFVFVDDGSTDGTLAVLKRIATQVPDVRYISFSRHFGKEAALLAGLEAARGDFVALMDADLQHPPELLPEMYDAVANGGFASAAAKRVSRVGESRIRAFLSRRFYRVLSKISDTDVADGATDFRLMRRQVVDAVLSLREYNRFTKGIFSWVGFSTKWVEYENVTRAAGRTKWSMSGLFLYSFDGIMSFSVKPLALSSYLGLLFCLLAFLGGIFTAVRWLIFGDPVQGWATIVCTILLVGGIQMFTIGILGQYLAKSYLEAKGRPVYVVAEKNFEDGGHLS